MEKVSNNPMRSIEHAAFLFCFWSVALWCSAPSQDEDALSYSARLCAEYVQEERDDQEMLQILQSNASGSNVVLRHTGCGKQIAARRDRLLRQLFLAGDQGVLVSQTTSPAQTVFEDVLHIVHQGFGVEKQGERFTYCAPSQPMRHVAGDVEQSMHWLLMMHPDMTTLELTYALYQEGFWREFSPKDIQNKESALLLRGLHPGEASWRQDRSANDFYEQNVGDTMSILEYPAVLKSVFKYAEKGVLDEMIFMKEQGIFADLRAVHTPYVPAEKPQTLKKKSRKFPPKKAQPEGDKQEARERDYLRPVCQREGFKLPKESLLYDTKKSGKIISCGALKECSDDEALEELVPDCLWQAWRRWGYAPSPDFLEHYLSSNVIGRKNP